MGKKVSILGKIAKGSEATIIQQLKQLEEVAEAQLVFGKYDFFATVKYDNTQLEEILEKIRKLEPVTELKILFPRGTGE